MGKSRDAMRLQRVAGSQVRAAILVDRPKGFANAKGDRFGDGVELQSSCAPTFVTEYERSLDPGRFDDRLDDDLGHGLYIGLSDTHVVVASRGPTGKAKAVLRNDPIGDVSVGFLDDEMHDLHTRYLHFDFPDGQWCLLATPWKRLIPDEVVVIIDAMGTNARRLDALAELRDGVSRT
ncbi:MAG: hypothetical protein ACR2PK_18855 [Acidimicrobiales bacterium]